VREYRDALERPSDDPLLSSLEGSWGAHLDLSPDEARDFDDMYGYVDGGENDGIYTPLEAYQDYLSRGKIPPPEILLAIGDFVSACLDGGISLEEAAFGPLKKGQGNYSKRRHHGLIYRLFDAYLKPPQTIVWANYAIGHTPEPVSLEVAAEAFLFEECEAIKMRLAEVGIKDELPEVEVFLRAYRRWRVQNGGGRKPVALPAVN